MDAQYSINRMSLSDAMILSDDIRGMVIKMTQWLESSYVNHQSDGFTLEFRDFFIRINSINEIKIDELTQMKRPEITLTEDCWQKDYSCQMRLDCTIYCELLICEYIKEKYKPSAFNTMMRMKIMHYINMTKPEDIENNDKIQFNARALAEPFEEEPSKKWYEKWQNWTGVIIILLILAVLIAILCYKYTKKKKRHSKAMFVYNPLVLLVAIGKYRNETDNLNAVTEDRKNMKELFGDRLGYDVFTRQSIQWRLKDLKEFMEAQAEFLKNNMKCGNFYDGLILIISCHGLKDHIIASDYKQYSKLAIQRTFSFWPVMREFPRFILFDCCSGGASREEDSQKIIFGFIRGIVLIADNAILIDVAGIILGYYDKGSHNLKKHIEVEDVFDCPDYKYWVGDDHNPDHLMATVEAANRGFVSNMSILSGSSLIRKMFDKYVQALDSSKPTPYIGKIFDEIQEELQKDKRSPQLPVATWNDQTDYLVFKKKNPKKVQSERNIKKTIDLEAINEESEGNARPETGNQTKLPVMNSIDYPDPEIESDDDDSNEADLNILSTIVDDTSDDTKDEFEYQTEGKLTLKDCEIMEMIIASSGEIGDDNENYADPAEIIYNNEKRI